MAFKGVVIALKSFMLCCGREERKQSLEIGSPTDVRHLDISESMPGLTNDGKKYVRGKISHDAIRLLSLHSCPPSPHTPSHPSSALSSILSSREPSTTLLNAASTNLPSSLPTPPSQKHPDTASPAFYMKSMWDRTRRLSTKSTRSAAGYRELDDAAPGYRVLEDAPSKPDDAAVVLGLDIDFKHATIVLDEPSTTAVVEGFEAQDVVGGTPTKKARCAGDAVRGKEVADAWDTEGSESDGEAMGE